MDTGVSLIPPSPWRHLTHKGLPSSPMVAPTFIVPAGLRSGNLQVFSGDVSMSRYKGRTNPKSIERDFPHIVEMVVPEGDLGGWLDAVYEFHARHGIQAQRGRSRRDDGRDYIRWCFADREIAAAFANEFGAKVD